MNLSGYLFIQSENKNISAISESIHETGGFSTIMDDGSISMHWQCDEQDDERISEILGFILGTRSLQESFSLVVGLDSEIVPASNPQFTVTRWTMTTRSVAVLSGLARNCRLLNKEIILMEGAHAIFETRVIAFPIGRARCEAFKKEGIPIYELVKRRESIAQESAAFAPGLLVRQYELGSAEGFGKGYLEVPNQYDLVPLPKKKTGPNASMNEFAMKIRRTD